MFVENIHLRKLIKRFTEQGYMVHLESGDVISLYGKKIAIRLTYSPLERMYRLALHYQNRPAYWTLTDEDLKGYFEAAPFNWVEPDAFYQDVLRFFEREGSMFLEESAKYFDKFAAYKQKQQAAVAKAGAKG